MPVCYTMWHGDGQPGALAIRLQSWTEEVMADDAAPQGSDLIERLREQGHHVEADHLARHLPLQTAERGVLFALREVCETILTAIEAIDPVTQTMIEELRLDVEKHLRLHKEGKTS
jgi:hypothetical protein